MKLIFLHIPKTGGTTLHHILKRIYDDEKIFTVHVINQKLATDQFLNLSQKQKDEIKVLKGHMHFGLHGEFSTQNVKYITFLRHPVERIISHYAHVKRSPNNKYHDIVHGKRMTLQDYAFSDLLPEIDNGQTRLISGKETIEINQCTEDMLKLAKQNIEKHFLLAGVKEKYNEGLITLKNLLSWESYPYYRTLNISNNKEKISNSLWKSIAERNHLDMKLYNYVVRKFELQSHAFENMSEELNILSQTNKAFENGYKYGYSQADKLSRKTNSLPSGFFRRMIKNISILSDF